MGRTFTPTRRLTPQASRLYNYLLRAKDITAREATVDLDMTSATLARRICDLENAGLKIKRHRERHPVTLKRFTRYELV